MKRFFLCYLYIIIQIFSIVDFTDAADLFGATVLDRQAPPAAESIGVTGIVPTITEIRQDSPALKMGLKQGDIVLYLDFKSVTNSDELPLRATTAKKLQVWRNGREVVFLLPTDKMPSVPYATSQLEIGVQSADTEKPLIFPQLGHSDAVHSVLISPDGKFVLSNGGNTLILWDITSGLEIKTFDAHSELDKSLPYGYAVAFSPDGKKFLTGGADKTVKLWDIVSGKIIRTFAGHSGLINSVAFSPDGKFFLSGSTDNTLKLWDIDNGKEIRTYEGHSYEINSVVFSKDGKYALSGSGDKTLKLWDIATGRELRTFKGHLGAVKAAVVSPDGRYALSVDDWKSKEAMELLSELKEHSPPSNENKTIKLWDVASGRAIKTFKGHTDWVNSIAFSPDSRYALSGSSDKMMKLWEVTSGRELRNFSGHSGSVTTVTFSPDGKNVLSGSEDSSLILWDITNGKEIRIYEGHSYRVNAVAYSPDGNYALSATSNKIRVWDGSGGKVAKSLEGHSKSVKSIALSPDGKYALSGSNDNTIKLWNVASGNEIKTLKGHSKGVNSVVFSPDGKYALSGSDDKTIKLWDINNSSEIKTFVGHSFYVHAVAFSPDGRFLLSGGEVLKLWDISSGREIFTFATESNQAESFAYSVSFTPDGKFALSGGLSGAIKVWDIVSGRQIRTLTGHSGIVNSFVFSPDGRYLLSGSSDCTLKLWEVSSGREIRTFKGRSGSIESVTFSPDGRYALSGSWDTTMRRWEISSGQEVIKYVSFDDDEWIAITPEGFFNTSPKGAKHLNVRVGNNVYSIDQLYSTLYRPDLVQAKLEGKDISAYAARMNINTLLTEKSLPPTVRFTTKLTSSDKPDITLSGEICDAGGGVGDVTLYLDDMPVSVDSFGRGLKAVSKTKEGCQIFEKLVTLQNGDNTISLMAYNKANTIESNRDSITITHKDKNIRKPALHVLTVAINNYRDGDLRLKYSIPDAEALSRLVTEKTGGLFENITIHNLHDDNVTKDKMKEKFADIGKTTKREDVFLLFVAGHGITNRTDGAYYFLPADFRYTDETSVTTHGISEDDLKRYLTSIQATKSLLLLDTCNSGSFAEAVASRGMIEKTAVNKLVRAVGRATIVASSKDQVALEGYEGHGVFTWTALEGMKGKAAANNGQITVNTLATFIEENLPKITYKKWGYEQIPQKSLMGMDFPIGMR